MVQLCACGCGLPAPIAPRTNRSKGWIEGQPLTFRRGHNGPRTRWDSHQPEPPSPCSVEGCGTDADCRGMCRMHYMRWLRRGDVDFEWKGSNVPSWVGSEAAYRTVHFRLAKQRGPAREYLCADCGKVAAHWSYDGTDPNESIDPSTGCAYSVDLDCYQARCVKCHAAYDNSLKESLQ